MCTSVVMANAPFMHSLAWNFAYIEQEIRSVYCWIFYH